MRTVAPLVAEASGSKSLGGGRRVIASHGELKFRIIVEWRFGLKRRRIGVEKWA